MINKAFLLKYGEIAIKGKNRYIFENVLIERIRASIKPLGEFDVKKEQGRLFVKCLSEDIDTDQVIIKLKKVFGLVGICPVTVLDTDDFEEIKKVAVEHMKEFFPTEEITFKVIARRSDKKYFMNSMEIVKEVGAYVLDNMSNVKVDVHKPDVNLWVEIRNKVYIYSKINLINTVSMHFLWKGM